MLEAGEKYSFNDDGSEMTIMEVSKLDEGDYTCIARNKAGESDQELSLTVFGKKERGRERVTMESFHVCRTEPGEYVGGGEITVRLCVFFFQQIQH